MKTKTEEVKEDNERIIKDAISWIADVEDITHGLGWRIFTNKGSYDLGGAPNHWFDIVDDDEEVISEYQIHSNEELIDWLLDIFEDEQIKSIQALG